MMTMAPKVPRSPNLPPPVGARTQGPRPFFLLPAMNPLPARPRRRRHPEGRSGAEEARSALPSSPGTGTMLSSRRKQEDHVATAKRPLPAPEITPFQSRPSRSKLSLVPLSRNWGPPQPPPGELARVYFDRNATMSGAKRRGEQPVMEPT